jgi:uncharacterized phage protein (TIGR01671 family)
MNRELKFRIWNGVEWVNPDEFTLFDLVNKNEKLKGYSIQQFTGLKDSDGKDIYEGDFVELKWRNKTVKNEIKYQNGSFMYSTLDDSYEGYSQPMFKAEGTDVIKKIIGHIYEERT